MSKEFIIRGGAKGVEKGRIRNFEEFIAFINNFDSSDDISEAIKYHRIKGDIRKWLESIGEKEFARRIKPFDTKDGWLYGIAVDILYDNKKDERIKLSNVIGYDLAKERLMEQVVHPDRIKALGKKYGRESSGKIILYGPPGCGKSFVARAIAGETSKLIKKESAGGMLSPGYLSAIVEVAKTLGDIVIYLDEMEALGAHREMDHGIRERCTTGGFLTAIDSLSERSDIVLIGTTNVPWLLDPALIRSGRFDDLIYMGIPNLEERIGLFREYSKKLPLGSVDFKALAEKTNFHSCADIAAICKEAASVPWRESLAGKRQRDVEQADYEAAMSRIGSTSIDWFEGAMSMISRDDARKRFEPMFNEIERYRASRKRKVRNDSVL